MSRISFWAPLVAASALIAAVNHFGPTPTTGDKPCFATAGQNVDKTSPTYQKYLALYTNLLQKNPGLRGEGASVCFHRDTPLERVRAFHDAMASFPGNGRWPALTNGTSNGGWQPYWLAGSKWPSKSITWSLVPDGTATGDGTTDTFAKFDAMFGGDRAKWVDLFTKYLTRWSSLGGLTYTRIKAGGKEWDDGVAYDNGPAGAGSATRGDMRIGGHDIDGALGILAWNYYPTYGEMVVDTSEDWGGSSVDDYRFLRNTLGHEHGHGLGIAHVCPNNYTKLMEPFAGPEEIFDGPQQDDVRACHAMYGDKFEPNNTASQAKLMASAVAGGAAVSIGTEDATRPAFTTSTSMTSSSDVDFLKVNLDKPTKVNISVIPVGSIYNDGPQAGDGSCTAGTPVDAQKAQNLAFSVYGADGVTLLGSANSKAEGLTESTQVTVPASGNFYIKVFSTGGTQVQMYSVLVTADQAGPVLAAATPSIIGQGTGPVTVNLSGFNLKTPMAAKWTSAAGIPTNISVSVSSLTSASVVLPNTLLTTLGTGTITLTNFEGASNAFPIKIAPNVTLASIIPTSIKLGQSARLTLRGTGFEKNTIVKVGTLRLKVILINSTSVQVFLPPSAFSVGGTYNVSHVSTQGVESNVRPLNVIGGVGS